MLVEKIMPNLFRKQCVGLSAVAKWPMLAGKQDERWCRCAIYFLKS